MAVINEFDEIVREHMNLMDRTTRKTIISLDEADQNQLLAALTSKLYDKIVEKVDDIDFGTIPRSRGDITKIENYTSLMECIDILRNIIVEYKENTLPIDTVSSAVENLKQRKALFMKAYALNVEMPIILYNTIALRLNISKILEQKLLQLLWIKLDIVRHLRIYFLRIFQCLTVLALKVI